MIANLLFVSSDDFPIEITRHFEKSGFSCFYSRGVLKTREILESQNIDTIIWLFLAHEIALAKDLLKVFNRHSKIPIIFITQTYEELDFAEDIKGLFANLDLNDDIDDIIKTVETACNQSIIIEKQPAVNETHEIDFKNAVSQIITDPESLTDVKINDNPLQQIDLWEAVDRSEKKILSKELADDAEEGVETKPEKPLLPKLKKILGRR